MFTFKEIYNSKSTLAGMHESAAKRIDWLRERIAKPGNYMSAAVYTKLCTNDVFRIESYNWWERQPEIENIEL